GEIGGTSPQCKWIRLKCTDLMIRAQWRKCTWLCWKHYVCRRLGEIGRKLIPNVANAEERQFAINLCFEVNKTGKLTKCKPVKSKVEAVRALIKAFNRKRKMGKLFNIRWGFVS
ncbi:MAG: hypothetical protein ACTS4U_01635, partial [Candidatus Hodgkinia cicadicola]